MLPPSFEVRSRSRLRLGPMSLEVRSNESHFAGFRFFANTDAGPANPADRPDFTLNLCNLSLDGPWPVDCLCTLQDRSYRGKKMSAGYYLTDHYGAPAYLISRGADYWIYAEDFEAVLWPYAIKHLLTAYSMEHNLLHLKAAGVVLDGQATLLLGRGGSGKTVMLSRLCQAGARFMSNTHTLVAGRTSWGIQTSMRVRKDAFFAPIIAQRNLAPSVKPGEYIANPLTDLGWSQADCAPVTTLCLLDYRQPGSRIIRTIDPQILFDYMEHFSLAVNVYGLKEDILDHLEGDVSRFSADASRVRAALHTLINESRCYYISCDAADAENLRAIVEVLRGD